MTKIGLALGGGGARGLAHIAVLEAFDELGLKPAQIVGTSIGGLIGAGYAGGMSGRDVKDHVLELLGDTKAITNTLWKLRPKNYKQLFQKDFWSGAPLDSVKVAELVLPKKLPYLIEELDIPFSAIAADYYGAKDVELNKGALRPAIAATIALPTIFQPVKIDGKLFIDGGVVNPLPFDKLHSTDINIAIDIMGVPEIYKNRFIPSISDAVFGSMQLLMKTIVDEKIKYKKPDLIIEAPVSGIRIVDFFRAQSVLDQTDGFKDTVKNSISDLMEAAVKKT